MNINQDCIENVSPDELTARGIALEWDIVQLKHAELFDLFMGGDDLRDIDFTGGEEKGEYGERGFSFRSKKTGRIFHAREIYEGEGGASVDWVIISTHGRADEKNRERINAGEQIISISDAEVMNACHDLREILTLEADDLLWAHPGAQELFWPQIGGNNYDL